jgi:decaprenylphospho-beta-D-erythro-pentofuranosid-2-ulose 2-reductase
MTNPRKKIVIVGATSSIAEHCARRWAQSTALELTLVGRNRDKLEQVAADLRVRSPDSLIEVREADFLDASSIRALADDIAATHGLDTILIAHGSLPDQRACQWDLAACEDALALNGTSPALFAEAFAGHLQKAGRGTLAVIGSVAGDRGRKSNYVYGAAKGMLERYLQGLQHRLAGSAVKVVLIKPGPTDTPMTSHLRQAGTRLAGVEDVARAIVAGIDRGAAVVYAPAKWWLIMQVIRHLPRFVFHRMNI